MFPNGYIRGIPSPLRSGHSYPVHRWASVVSDGLLREQRVCRPGLSAFDLAKGMTETFLPQRCHNRGEDKNDQGGQGHGRRVTGLLR
jgi:hypothetical protein